MRTFSWWAWLATLMALLAGRLGVPGGVEAAIVLSAANAAHASWRTRRVTSLPVQVRVAYLVLLVVGMWPPARFVHWMQGVGTVTMLVFDYCPLARLLVLLPWNRTHALTWRFVRRLFLTPPVAGSILAVLGCSANEAVVHRPPAPVDRQPRAPR
jgi:hypothetical protein